MRPRMAIIVLSAPFSASLYGSLRRMAANRSSCSTWYGFGFLSLPLGYVHFFPPATLMLLDTTAVPFVPWACSETLVQQSLILRHWLNTREPSAYSNSTS